MGMFNFDIKTILRDRARDLKNNYDYPGNVDITTIGGIRNTAKAEFFTENNMPEGNLRPEVMMLDENFREFFMTAFPLHYFNDEIGLETLPLFKVALSAKIYENAGYMNSIFESLDKQALHSYRVHRVDTNGSYNDTKVDTDNISRSVQDSHSGTVQTMGTETGTVQDTGTQNGSVTNVNDYTGTDKTVTTNTGTQDNVTDIDDKTKEMLGGTDTFNKNLTETVNYGKTNTRTGQEENTHESKGLNGIEYDDYKETTTIGVDEPNEKVTTLEFEGREHESKIEYKSDFKDQGTYKDTDSGKDEFEKGSAENLNSTVVTADTPQGSLGNIRGSSVRKGDGIEAGVGGGATFNYMSAAQMHDQTVQGEGKDTTHYGKVVTHEAMGEGYGQHRTGDDTTTDKDTGKEITTVHDAGVNSVEKEGKELHHVDLKDVTDYKNVKDTLSGADTTTHIGYDNTQYGKITDTTVDGKHTEKRTDDLKQDAEETKDLHDNLVETRDLVNNNTQTRNLNNTGTETRSLLDNTTDNTNRNGNENASGVNSNHMEETDNMYSLEFLAMSEPFMNKIWDIFDDIFMQVIDVWP